MTTRPATHTSPDTSKHRLQHYTLDTSYGLRGENSNWFKVDYGDRQKPFLVTAFTAFIFEMNEMDFSFMRLTESSFSTLLNFHLNLSLAVTRDCGCAQSMMFSWCLLCPDRRWTHTTQHCLLVSPNIITDFHL